MAWCSNPARRSVGCQGAGDGGGPAGALSYQECSLTSRTNIALRPRGLRKRTYQRRNPKRRAQRQSQVTITMFTVIRGAAFALLVNSRSLLSKLPFGPIYSSSTANLSPVLA